MPRAPQCLICIEPATRVAVDELRSQGLSIRDIASKTRRTRASVHRHLRHAAGKPGSVGAQAVARTSSQARRSTSGRCAACGLMMTATDAESLLRRAERLLWLAETIAAQAQKDDDARLALQAVDRARASMETMMRGTGLIGGEGQVTVNIDARKRVVELLSGFHEATIRAFERGDCQHCGKSLLVDGAPALGEPKMSTGEIGTPIRDEKASNAT
jgi:hypothetical protein